MIDEPAGDDLAEVVASFLRTRLMPALDGQLAFDARVAANALELVVREMRLGPAAGREENARLCALLGRDGTLDALNREFCFAIREGRVTGSEPAVVEHLRATTLAKLAIDQPGYATYRDVLARGWDGVADEPWPDASPNDLPQHTPSRTSS
jgi:hypothetical protein